MTDTADGATGNESPEGEGSIETPDPKATNEQDPLTQFGREQRDRRGDGALADASLAGDEEEAPVE